MYKLSDIWIANEAMNNYIVNLWNKNIFLHNVWFQKLSIPPPWKGFFFRPTPPPHPSGNSSQASYILLKFRAFENPPALGMSYPFSGGSMDIFWNLTM